MNIGLIAVDRSAFALTGLTDPSPDKAYWLSRTPEERLQAVAMLRRINYGAGRPAAGLQRILEIARRA
ncbi:MAG: hypothetical protein ACYC9Y_08470 [Candidatus Methylomirabilia bacterium]